MLSYRTAYICYLDRKVLTEFHANLNTKPIAQQYIKNPLFKKERHLFINDMQFNHHLHIKTHVIPPAFSKVVQLMFQRVFT